jgi:predicted aldo/keto reductase-like oxidoreductase
MPIEPSGDGHLPGCKVITYRELYEKMEVPTDPDDEWYDQAGILDCEENCPRHLAMLKYAEKRFKELDLE